MKTGFPHRNWLGFPKGWEDLGKVGTQYVKDDLVKYDSHSYCRTKACIGRENGVLFKFCPKCKIKLD
jgi:hypothetical protein